ncbi:acyltransferase family protein [Pseudoalteromonas luteoviolacea]|uniref:acyltransferase family protein n=1 Tax=Pseudoalteromonas luteoviolacea TaxID=43657 RepID=UPI00126A32D8|nr:acyltransferase family protein [Pseudoalteromonas luteoviolacea]
MKYRSDIDGLRAIAVMSVVAFHSGITALSGGYVGVDVFFVISGYLITTLIYNEMKNNDFSFGRFYKRRAARLLPALFITLFVVLVFGFINYNNKTFDNLGKEIFFSSFGGANILFAQGVNYFAKDEAYQPLIHMWSLGVEEQFYIIWPVILLLTYKFAKKLIIPVASILFFISLGLSINSVAEGQTKGYFLLHYRAFELLVGVITALLILKNKGFNFSENVKQVLSYTGLFLIAVPMLILDETSKFPGVNALWPCIGTALIISFPNNGLVTKLLSHKWMVFVGLISYPLYLYHQPLISFIYFFNLQLSSLEMFSVVTLISTVAAWLTYKYVEKPCRRMVHSTESKASTIKIASMAALIPMFAVVGLFIAKTNGFEARFKYLNPFALEISAAHSQTFHENFERGFKVSDSKESSVLFVGDSVLQHYILPMKLALNLADDDVDTVTRGGCVLLKGADFIDKFSDISCNDLRVDLYNVEKKYKYVVLSQAWSSYGSSVLNFDDGANGYSKWSGLLDNTVEHFLKIADKVIIFGAHPQVNGTLSLQPSITSSKETFINHLNRLEVTNISQLNQASSFFERYNQNKDVLVIEPSDIFCQEACTLHNGEWSFYSDSQHLSNAATDYVSSHITKSLL